MMKAHYQLPAPTYARYACYPESVGRYSGDPRHVAVREEGVFPYYNLHLVCGGQGYLVRGGERIELQAGEGFLYPKHVRQEYGSSASEPWDIRWAHFDMPVPLAMLDGADPGEVWLLSYDDRERVERLTDRMYDLGTAFETRSEPEMSALLYALLAEVLPRSKRDAGAALPREQQAAIRAVADSVRGRCQLPWSLDRMAALSGYSAYHFHRLFTEVLGQTPNRYLQACRIVRAKSLLASTRLPVKAVADECGFAQVSYFIRSFRKAEGLTPADYRRVFGQTQSHEYD
ncbi:AraC family transcriptional regulator [Cohnella nanjingensis]|uniref:Helix-turn-helix domain-containing protein n=1 Tax=Cohnella nanjingensis TaxID=1387779 RepID=A0A7X0RUA8_9BACL|nr:AraC family transcriptional regulator [Cohnella nanjingensis]MBB6673842.1 helix-turn-helix domain-containing protein [Cohnella nanjingensis]